MSQWSRFGPTSYLVASIIAGLLCASTAGADPGTLPAEVRSELGQAVVEAFTAEELRSLSQACPQPEAKAVVDCLRNNAQAQQVRLAATRRVTAYLTNAFGQQITSAHRARLFALSNNDLARLHSACPESLKDQRADCVAAKLGTAATPGTGAANTTKTDYPARAVQLLGTNRLDKLPKLITNYLTDEDWEALAQLCKANGDALLACMGNKPKELEQLVSRRIISSMLALMDVEIPRNLTSVQLDALGKACEKQGEAWGKCVIEHGTDSDKCRDPEAQVSSCLVENEVVSEVYLAVAQRKVQLFGEALYVELAGLLALMTFDQVKELRGACPQTDQTGAMACFRKHAVAGQYIAMFEQLATAVVKKVAADLAKHNVAMDVPAYSQQVVMVLLQMPIHAIGSLAAKCEKAHPEYEHPKTLADVDNAIACVRGSSMTDPVGNPAYISVEQLKRWLGVAKTKVIAALVKKEERAQQAALGRIWIALLVIAGLGFLAVMLMPLFLGKRYPSQSGLLWKSSAVAAVTLAVTIGMLGVSLTVMRSVQGAVATESTSPKIRVVHGAFNALERKYLVEGFSFLSQAGLDFIKTPMKKIVEAKEKKEEMGKFGSIPAYLGNHWADQLETPQMKRLAAAIQGTTARAKANIAKIKGHVGTFKSAIGVYKKVDWVMGIIPVILALLAVVLYMLPLRHTLVDIASAPARAAAQGAAGGTVGQAMGTVWAEVKSALPFIALIVVLLPITGFFLAYAINPLVEMLLVSSVLSVFYIATADVSTFVLFVGMLSVMLLLVFCLATYILGLTFALGTTRKIFRAKFHFGHTLGDFGRFWKWGVPAFLLLMVLPLLYSYAIDFAYKKHISGVDMPIAGKYLITVPLIAALSFPLVFWAARGLRAVKFIMKYPVPTSLGHVPNVGEQDATVPTPRVAL